MIRSAGGRPVQVVRLGHPRRARTARRMAAMGWPRWRICDALGLSRRRLAVLLDAGAGEAGAGVWATAHLEAFRAADTGVRA